MCKCSQHLILQKYISANLTFHLMKKVITATLILVLGISATASFAQSGMATVHNRITYFNFLHCFNPFSWYLWV